MSLNTHLKADSIYREGYGTNMREHFTLSALWIFHICLSLCIIHSRIPHQIYRTEKSENCALNYIFSYGTFSTSHASILILFFSLFLCVLTHSSLSHSNSFSDFCSLVQVCTWLILFRIFNWSVASVFYSIFLALLFHFSSSSSSALEFCLPFIERLFFSIEWAEMRG